MGVAGDHAPGDVLELPDVGEAAEGEGIVGGVGDLVVAHGDDGVAVAVEGFDGDFVGEVAEAAGFEEGEELVAGVDAVEGGVDGEVIGPEFFEGGIVAGEEGGAGLFLEGADLGLPGGVGGWGGVAHSEEGKAHGVEVNLFSRKMIIEVRERARRRERG